ncbi:DNA-binding protein [Escherichia coli]|uniref:DNA-binding protein n=1 Tax=Escherichia coli TaxID=562 RepID=UPI0007C3A7F0|nr:DNA-binding protein [Escherichia coli]MCW3219935.1 DNA-binding protein [Escherichia coli]MDI0697151.1 DNA-binding protein [Escherichia coli]MDI0700213.1 DNA-binding protein [Escherichia coli]MDI0808718.1 DNA-binding protein [Escherichia coli]MDI0888974.1 DNA-binding protein [Escherichia coli]
MSRLIKLLDRPIAYNPAFAKLKAGKVRSGPVAAVFLSQLVYWHNRMDGGWMYKTQSDISAETALTRDEQETARKRLVALGVLEEKLRGIPAIMHYRINTERLEALLIEQVKPDTKADSNESSAANIKNVGTPQSEAGQYREQVCGNPANCGVETPQTVMRDHRKPSCGNPANIHTGDYTENTHEITHETKNTIGASADASAPARSARQEYSPEFEQAWQEYPKRAGGNSKSAAFKAWKARIREGVTPETMLDGVRRYAAWVRATGNTGTQFVKQTATFFGPDRHFEDFWQQPAAPGGGRQRQIDILSGLGAMSDEFGKSSDNLTF